MSIYHFSKTARQKAFLESDSHRFIVISFRQIAEICKKNGENLWKVQKRNRTH